MIILNDKKCVGCSACTAVCPKNCISMAKNDEGFEYPVVDAEQCIDCHLCEKVCIAQNEIKEYENIHAYAAFNKNDYEREKSSSGGVFCLLAKTVLDAGGIVFGAAFNPECGVEHIEIENMSDLPRLQTSKYVQSSTNGIYPKVKEAVESGRPVLFTGTPCQCNALSLYLGKSYENLFVTDVICHGVPSPLAWEKYIKTISTSEIKNVNFRDKKSSWKNYCVSIAHAEKTESTSFRQNPYMKLFLSDSILRQSCYQCNSRFPNKASDLTLGDLWGAENIAPDMDDDKGLSLVIVNSDKGKKILESISPELIIKKICAEEAFKSNPSARQSCAEPKKRKMVMDVIKSNDYIDFEKLAAKATKTSIIKRAIRKLLRIIKKAVNWGGTIPGKARKLWKDSKALKLISKIEDKKFRKRLTNTEFTVLTPNCMAGLIYHRLGERFNSPTINISMETDDFCDFLDNLDYYVLQDVCEYKENARGTGYPRGMIKGNGMDIPDIKINFVHYKTFEDGREKWNERKKRIIRDNTYVILCDIDDIYEVDCSKAGFASEEALRKFERFKCNNKVLLTRDSNKKQSYSVYVEPNYGKPFPLTYMNRNVLGLNGFERKFDFVSFLNKK